MKVTVTANKVPQEEKCFEEKLDEKAVEIIISPEVERKEPPQEEKSLKENVDQETEILQKEKVIPVLEETEKQEEVTTEIIEKGIEVKVEAANLQIDSPKKSKQVSKQTHKMKVTVPKPFSLETEKRMYRERRGSMDFNDSKPHLSKALSLNYKNTSQSYLGPERSSDLMGNGTSSTTKTGLKLKAVPDKKIDKIVVFSIKTQNGSLRKEKGSIKDAEKRKPQVPLKLQKHEGNEMSNNKLQKNPKFKALPLPSFYHQKDTPPKPETKKIRVTQSKPPLATEQTKTVLKTDYKKTEEKERKVSGKIGSSTKETISKLFKATRNSLGNPKEKVKAVVSGA